MRRILTGPNLLTLSRLLTAAASIALFRNQHFTAAACTFLAAMLTDCLDGWLARRTGTCTRLGIYLDPIVDKIVVLAMFYELARCGLVPLSAAHLLLARELCQNGVRGLAALQGTVVGANWMGKTKAVMQTTLIMAGLLTPRLAPAMTAVNSARLYAALNLGTWLIVAMVWAFFFEFIRRNRGLFGAGATGPDELDGPAA